MEEPRVCAEHERRRQAHEQAAGRAAKLPTPVRTGSGSKGMSQPMRSFACGTPASMRHWSMFGLRWRIRLLNSKRLS